MTAKFPKITEEGLAPVPTHTGVKIENPGGPGT